MEKNITLKELLDLKLVHENVKVVDLDTVTNSGAAKHCSALQVFNRPVEIEDFKPNKQNSCNILDCLSKNVVAIFGSKNAYKTIIQVSSKKRV